MYLHLESLYNTLHWGYQLTHAVHPAAEEEEICWIPLCSETTCPLFHLTPCFKWSSTGGFDSQLSTINCSLAPVWLITHLKHRWPQNSVSLSSWKEPTEHLTHTHACMHINQTTSVQSEPPPPFTGAHPTHQDQCRSLLAAGSESWLCKRTLPVLASHLPKSTAGLDKHGSVRVCV